MLSAAFSGCQSDLLRGMKNDDGTASIPNGPTFAEVLTLGPAYLLLLQPQMEAK